MAGEIFVPLAGKTPQVCMDGDFLRPQCAAWNFQAQKETRGPHCQPLIVLPCGLHDIPGHTSHGSEMHLRSDQSWSSGPVGDSAGASLLPESVPEDYRLPSFPPAKGDLK